MCSTVSSKTFQWGDPNNLKFFSWDDPATYKALYYYTSETNSSMRAEFNLFSCVAGSSSDKLELLVPSGWPLGFNIEGIYACEPGSQQIPIICTKKLDTSIDFSNPSKISFSFNSTSLRGSIISIKFNGVNPVKKGIYQFNLIRLSGDKIGPMTGPANYVNYVGSHVISID